MLQINKNYVLDLCQRVAHCSEIYKIFPDNKNSISLISEETIQWIQN